jgi:hypothetical protein
MQPCPPKALSVSLPPRPKDNYTPNNLPPNAVPKLDLPPAHRSYFKEEAITWAWDCLTSEFGLDPTRLYATYFGGDAAQGLAPDEEAKAIWLRFLPPNRVLPFGCKVRGLEGEGVAS